MRSSGRARWEPLGVPGKVGGVGGGWLACLAALLCMHPVFAVALGGTSLGEALPPSGQGTLTPVTPRMLCTLPRDTVTHTSTHTHTLMRAPHTPTHTCTRTGLDDDFVIAGDDDVELSPEDERALAAFMAPTAASTGA